MNYRSLFRSRVIALTGMILCALAMLFALFLQYQMNLEPCKLCYLQRVVVILLGVVFACMFIHNPMKFGIPIYATLANLLCLAGIATAGRHIWLQNLPEHRVPACGPSIDYMLESFTYLETLKSIWEGAGDCADVSWTFLGLTIPEQLMIYFVGMTVLSLSLFWTKASAPKDDAQKLD